MPHHGCYRSSFPVLGLAHPKSGLPPAAAEAHWKARQPSSSRCGSKDPGGHIADQALRGPTAPSSHAPLQRTQVSHVVMARITRLELDEELECCLIRLRFQALDHFSPMVLEQILASATRLVGETPMLKVLNDDAAGARVLPPALDAPIQ